MRGAGGNFCPYRDPLNDNEIPIYDEALTYQRGEYWQMRMWLGKESKYARFSLRTRNRDTAYGIGRTQQNGYYTTLH